MHYATINLNYGDHMEAMTKMKNNQYKLAVVDPNYGIRVDGHRENNRSKLAKSKKYHPALWDQKKPTKEYFDELFRVTEHQIIWGVNYFTSIYDFGPGRIIWDKVNSNNAFSDCEIAYCSLHESTRLFRFMWAGMMQGRGTMDGHIHRGNKKANEERIHPTQKPIELYKWLLETYAEEGWGILDTGFGSASIGIACWDLKFDLDGWEKERIYYLDGLERFERHSEKMLFH